MITHGRVDTLVEALHSFLIQDYPPDKCELIIVNDYPFQTLLFDHPRVRIYNLTNTFNLIGEKENYAIERCKGELIAVWDDDDIALPNHLSNIAKYWTKDTNILQWSNAVYYNEPEGITALTSVGNSGIVYSKQSWKDIGYSPLMNAGGDMVLVDLLKKLPGKTIKAHPNNEDVSWFYMWGGRGVYHQSGQGTDTPDRKNIVQRNSEFVEKLRKERKIPVGRINLIPMWKKDYKKELTNFLKNK